MTQFLRLIAILLLTAALARGQEFPTPTPEGQKGLQELLEACDAAGAVKLSKDPAPHLTVADAAKLKAVFKERRALLTPAVRDALIARWQKVSVPEEPTVIVLLRALGDEVEDDRALAFASFLGGRSAERTAEYAAALKHYRQALDRFVRLRDAIHQANCLNSIGSVYSEQGEFAKAIEAYQQCLSLRRKAQGDEHPDVAIALNNLGEVHRAAGERGKALEYYQDALRILRKVHGNGHANVANVLNNIGLIYSVQGELPKALDYHRQALAIRRKVVGEASTDTAASLSNIGVVLFRQGQLGPSLEHLQQAAEIQREALGDRHPTLATMLNNIGLVHAELGDQPAAIQQFQQALAIWKRTFGPAHPLIATALNNLGASHLHLAEFAQARDLHRQALEIQRRSLGPQHPDTARSLNNLGVVCVEQGEYGQAEDYYRQALELHRRAFGEVHPEVAIGLANLGTVHVVLGNHAQALAFHRQALAIRRRLLGEEHRDVARNLHFIAASLLNLGEHNLSLDYHRQALAMRRKLLGPAHLDVASSLNQIGMGLSLRGDLAGALEHFQQALALDRKALGARHPASITRLINIAQSYATRGDHGLALQTMTEAAGLLCLDPKQRANLDQLSAADFRPLPQTAQVLYYRGWYQEQCLGSQSTVDELRGCAHTYQLAADLLDRLRRDVLHSETSQLFLGAERFDLFPRRIGILRRLYEAEGKVEHLHAAVATAELGTARVLLQQLGQARAQGLGGVDAELRRQEADLLRSVQALDLRIARAQDQPLERRDAELIGKLHDQRRLQERKLNQLISQMERDHPQYAAWKYPQPCTLAQARACLAANEVALLFVPGEEVSYLVLIEARPKANDPNNGVAIYPLPDATTLAELVETLTDPETLVLPARLRLLGTRAYEALLRPCRDRLQGKDLVVVPGGPLCHLPFELLIESTGYLLEKHRIRYAPSLTALHLLHLWEQTRQRPGTAFWGMGDPVYDLRDDRAAKDPALMAASRDGLQELQRREGRFLSDVFGRLVHSGAEVRSIAGFLQAPRENLLTGLDALETKVKEASASGRLGQARYVHFATHGILGLDTGQQPALVLSLVGNDGKPADNGINDGFLRLDEVTHLKLNADLVVLSACRSGQGRLHNGEGVVGLSRAFLYAGSRGVVCSLWSVDDQETASLMTAMYSKLKQGQPAVDALRDAKLAMIRAGKAPLYWAPFILIGE